MASKSHVMLIPFPAQGHMNPMMQFSKRLASKGIRVTLVAPSDLRGSITTTNSTIHIEYISHEFDEDEKPYNMQSYMAFVTLKVRKNLTRISHRQSASGHPVNFLVFDSLYPSGVEMSHELGLKGAPFFTQSCAVGAIYYHVQQGKLNIPPADGSPTISFPSMPLLGLDDLPVCEIAKWLSTQWKISTIGPAIPSMYLDKRLADDNDYSINIFKPDAEACIKWLDSKNPGSVVYVSFGSVSNLNQEHMNAVALGLLNSNSYFLWVVRDSEQAKLSSDFITRAADKGLIVSWCPQLQVLSHKSVGSFMTHCGWNSTLEALSLGVPMMVFPQWFDQTTNTKFVVDVWGVGMIIKVDEKGVVASEEVAICVKEVMEGKRGDELRAKAIIWKELAVEAMQEGGSSDKNIEEFISKLVSS